MPTHLALAVLAAPLHLRAPDLLLVAVYLAGITLFGLRFRKHTERAGKPADRSLRNYFLANNTVPWWAIALSIVSAETSTLTIISIPGVAFGGDFGFLQVVLGYMLGRLLVAALFLPRYFSGQMLTAYQLIDRRFGALLHKVTAGLFLLTRAAAEGVRVFAVSIVVGIAIGTRDVLSIAIISLLTLAYTFEGGMAAVIWTDVVQMAIYVAGTAVALVTLGSHVAGGWPHIVSVAGAAGKFHMFSFALNLTQTYTFWAGLLGGGCLTMASHGTDQLMVQRLLAARSLRQSQAALLSSGVVIFVQFAMFLLIGAGLFVFYAQHPDPVLTHAGADRLFPAFIVREMPVGVAGLLVAAILAAAMSNLSAALNSLASTTVVDFYVRLRPAADDRERARMARASTLLWAVVLFAIAVYSVQVGGKGHVVEIGLSIASAAYGCLLGVFLLGTLTRWATQLGTAVGMVTGFALNVWLWQGNFPTHLGPLTVPRIAWTWYVLIGAAVTFAVGAVASLLTPARRRHAITAAACILLLAATRPTHAQTPAAPTTATSAPDFSRISTILTTAIAEHKLPGAVVVIGHDGKVVFQQAYGNRKLAGEPGLDGQPAPEEPMTEDTLFDMASLSKCLATATSIMQLYEQGKLGLDTPVETYLPGFNPTHDPARHEVTVRLLLTHTSGERPDLDLRDPWGLASPNRAEGLHRALTTPLMSTPGRVFRYSDINFILLGAILEHVSGQREDDYVRDHVFGPLAMHDTTYHAFDRVCGLHHTIGAAVYLSSTKPTGPRTTCARTSWDVRTEPLTAPTAHDDELHAAQNPNFDHLLRGTVHDPSTRRMGGVAGHAGVFSTAHDISLFAQALLDRLAGRPSTFPLQRATLELMTHPQQPSTVLPETILTRDLVLPEPTLVPARGTPVRGLGWDINTAFSRPRGAIFPTIGPSDPPSMQPSFGHTGFTGTSLWMDPRSNTYVILLANAIHPRGGAPISPLRSDVATAAAAALNLDSLNPPPAPAEPATATNHTSPTLLGIDVLERDRFRQLNPLLHAHGGSLNLGLLTNQTGLDSKGRRTADILAQDMSAALLHDLPSAIPGARLVRLFSPEHGLFGRQDTMAMKSETDADTHLPVVGLYGAHDAERRPSHEQLADLDAVVIDLQDAGVRFYTYETVMGYFLEAAAREQKDFNHRLDIIVLDRPDPIGGVSVQGPVSEPGRESYTNYMPLPARHGLTMGELAQYINATKSLAVPLTVVPLEHWTRNQYFDETGLPWIDPSPNLRTVRAEVLYPALALFEGTNVSVGRGTPTPFEWFGAGTPPPDKSGAPQPAWFNAADVVAALNERHIPGVRFDVTPMTVAEDSNHYPFHGQTFPAVHVTVTDRTQLQTSLLGLEIMSALHRLYPEQFKLSRALALLADHATLDALTRGDDPRQIVAGWQPALNAFEQARRPYLLYQAATPPAH